MMKYDKDSPYLASIKERFSLCLPGSKKETQHIVIDIGGSGIQYAVGDSIGILPRHDRELVEKTLDAMKEQPDTPVVDPKSGQALSLYELLAGRRNITEVSKKFLTALNDKQSNFRKKESLSEILSDRQKTKDYIANRELWQILREHSEAEITTQEICDLLKPLLPRFYSIASSPLVHQDEVHLTVALVNYETSGYARKGVCTHYLCREISEKGSGVPIYVQPHRGFTLPEDGSTPIIMIGPGTGIAPFRAFMQERIATGATGNNWLFFGEWTSKHEFFYRDFWEELISKKRLKADFAFSRDQEHKVYVQHHILSQAREFFRWVEDGAVIYLCGDANRMAKDVDDAIAQVIKEQGGLDDIRVKEYIKTLRQEKRYLKDVY